MKIATFGLALIAPLLVAATSSAQSVAAAETLFQEGQAALERGDLAAACPKLRESDRLDPANGTKLNLADCEEKSGHVGTAWELYRKLSELLPADDERLAYVKSRVDELDVRVPRLTLVLAKDAPADTIATLGTISFTAASFGIPLPVDPGARDITVTAGAAKRTYHVTLAEGVTRRLEVTPEPEPRDEPSVAATAAPGNDRTPTNHRTLGYVLGGVGVAGLAVGSIAGLIGLHQQSIGNDNCSDVRHVCNQQGVDANDSARAMRPVSMVGLLIGVAGVGAGAYFILTSSSDERVALSAHTNGESASLAIRGRW